MPRLTLVIACLAAMAVPLHAADIAQPLRGPIEPPAPPMPQGGWYVGARGGWTQLENTRYQLLQNDFLDPSYKASLGASGFVGYDFGPLFGSVGARVEGEVAYSNTQISRSRLTAGASTANFNENSFTGSASSLIFLANGYLDFDFGIVRPYLSAGLGYGAFSLRDQRILGFFFNTSLIDASTAQGFAYQLGAGVSVPVTRNVDAELGYRYIGMTDLDIRSVTNRANSVDANLHQVNIGLRIKF